MKYYISEFWKMANSSDPRIRDEGIKKWANTAKEYGPYFEKIKNKLPLKFISQFEKNNWFHDFTIDNIQIITGIEGHKIKVAFNLSHDNIIYEIKLLGVTSLLLNIPSTQYWLCGRLTWGYSEFELHDDGMWSLRVLCDIECEIEFLFEQIRIESGTK